MSVNKHIIKIKKHFSFFFYLPAHTCLKNAMRTIIFLYVQAMVKPIRIIVTSITQDVKTPH